MRDAAAIIGDFDISSRSMWLSLDLLRLVQAWDLETSSEESGAAVVSERLDGQARLERGDALRLVGSKVTHRGALSATVRPYATREARVKDQRDPGWLRGEEPDEYSTRLIKMQREEFQTRPWTAAIGFTAADAEIGNADEWWVELWLPREVFDKLLLRLRHEPETTIGVGIERPINLIGSRHSWPSVPEVFGILADGVSYGWIESFRWEPTKYAGASRPGAVSEDGDSDDTEEEEATPAPRLATAEELRFVMTESLAAVRAVQGWILLVGLLAVLGLFF